MRTGYRTCWVHVGTHKTGTTAIQRFLAANADLLARNGLYYPRAGRMSNEFPGHHNVAFELNGDARFAASAGTLADVVGEIAAVEPEVACLSSEDFEYLHVRVDALVALRDALVRIGYEPRIVICVRAQDEYAESLYAELAKHGITAPFASVFDDIVRDGVLRYERGWIYRFAYTTLVERFAAVFGTERVVVHGYLPVPRKPLVAEFLNLVGMTAGQPFVSDARAPEDNPRLSTGGVIERLYANTAAYLDDERIAAVGADLTARNRDVVAEPFRPLAHRDRERIAARFADDNASLVRSRDVAPAAFERAPGRPRTVQQARAAAVFHVAERVRAGFLNATPAVKRSARA